jgi:uncharacterized protein (PEP-CTERM system associated)
MPFPESTTTNIGKSINNQPKRQVRPGIRWPITSITAAGTLTSIASSLVPSSLSLLLSLLLSQPAGAAEWTIRPGIQGSETYTDNVTLAPKAQAKSDFVTEITPSISVTGKGRNLDLTASYAAQEILYAQKNAPSALMNQLHLDARARLIDDLFFFDSMAAVTQQSISAFGSQANSNIYNSGNQTTVRTYRVSPYLKHAFDALATAELRYAYDSVTANTGGLSSNNSDTISAKVDSGKAFRILGWGMKYNDQVIHYPSTANVELQTLTSNFSYLIAPALKLTATAGYDHNDYAALGGLSKGYSWTTGFDWTVSQRTSLVAAAGHRYYGDTMSLSAVTRSRIANWMLSYDETVTTTQSQVALPTTINTASYLDQLLSGTVTDPVVRAQAINQIIQSGGLPSSLASSVNYFTNNVFLQKQLQASVVFNTPRTTLLMTLFDTQREPLSVSTGLSVLNANDKTNQFGGSAVFSRRLSARTSANLTLVASKVESLTTGRVDRNQSLKVGLSRQLTRKLRGNVEIRRNQGQSSLPGVGYNENAIATYLNFQL